MVEGDFTPETLEQFREQLAEQMELALLIIGSGQEQEFAVDPFTFGMGEEILEDLPPRLQTALRTDLYERLQMHPTEKPEPITTYTLPDEDPQEYEVKVFKGKFDNPDTESTDEIFLHEIVRSDGLNWIISNSPNPSPLLIPPTD